jgi:hypothetical protein
LPIFWGGTWGFAPGWYKAGRWPLLVSTAFDVMEAMLRLREMDGG